MNHVQSLICNTKKLKHLKGFDNKLFNYLTILLKGIYICTMADTILM